jgi:hypothetical protein
MPHALDDPHWATVNGTAVIYRGPKHHNGNLYSAKAFDRTANATSSGRTVRALCTTREHAREGASTRKRESVGEHAQLFPI